MRRGSERRQALGAIALALGIGGAAASGQMAGLFEQADAGVYDWLTVHATAPPPGRDGVVVVAIDDPSFAELGLPWPWPRALHGALIEGLRGQGARAIGYDVVFADPGQPEGDAALAAALGPDVVLAGYSAVSETPQGDLRMFVGPAPVFSATGARTGSIDLSVDFDGAIRRLPTDPASFTALLAGSPAPPPPGALLRYDPAGTPTVSFYQALDAEGSLPPGTFRDKVVLVGTVLKASPATSADTFRTPLTAAGRGFLSGVQIHAQALRTLASGTWILPVPSWVPVLLALALAGATALTGLIRAVPLAVAATAGLTLLPPALAAGGMATGVWIPPAAATLAAAAGGAAQILSNYLRERRARRHITRVFGHYLAPELVRRLADNPDALELGGERREITILFCDLRGFTTLSERLAEDPVTLTRIVNLALGALAEAVIANNGMVDKFIGDCVMALWNAPADDADHADHAIAAARDMIAGIEALSAQLSAEGLDVALACGVGINSGFCTVGNMGSARRFDYTAIGDPVNLASRLESLTKEFGTPVLVGAATAALVRNTTLTGLGETKVKGRQGLVQVFGLTGMRGQAAS